MAALLTTIVVLACSSTAPSSAPTGGVLGSGDAERFASLGLAASPYASVAEITSALDAATADSVMALLTELRAAGLAIMLISHDLPLVHRHADTVLEL